MVLTPTFFNEGHGIQLLRAFVSLLQLSPWRRNTAQDHLLPRSPVYLLPAQGLQPAAGQQEAHTPWRDPDAPHHSGSLQWLVLSPPATLEGTGAVRRDPATFPTDAKARFGVPRPTACMTVSQYLPHLNGKES